jgi:hypothetical protein
MKTALQLEITYEQILSLIRQLPHREKIRLTKELEKEVIESKLSQLLKTFKTDELDIATIDDEVEKVRKELYEKRKR